MMELKPCVFCGHTETKIAYDGNCYTAIECKLCRARGPLTDGPHLAEIEWNTRTPPKRAKAWRDYGDDRV